MFTLQIKVKPGSKIDKLSFENNYLIAKIKGRAKEGEANKYLIEFLAKELKIAKSLITIDPKSLKSKYKKISIDADKKEVWTKLEENNESENLF